MRFYDTIRDYPCVSIVGMCKNAGKTTAMTKLIEAQRETNKRLALTSIGRDGERTDLVSGTKKPPIFVYSKTLVATASAALKECDFTRKVIADTGLMTPLGEVIVAEALSDGYAMLAGPSMNEGLVKLKAIFRELMAEQIFIDGALFRKSFSAPEICDAVILCTGASCKNDLASIVSETANAAKLLTLPASDYWHTLPLGRLTCLEDGVPVSGEADELSKLFTVGPSLFVRGAVTDAVIAPLFRLGSAAKGRELCCEDGSRVFLSPESVTKLERLGVKLCVLSSVPLAAITVNPFSANGVHQDPDRLFAAMSAAVSVPVFDVMKGQ
ncbi:MAG TPA: hypothetical protein PLM48_06130 [Clostridia bacterium]|nr:hypothetical protein [Clostridia bacterium]